MCRISISISIALEKQFSKLRKQVLWTILLLLQSKIFHVRFAWFLMMNVFFAVEWQVRAKALDHWLHPIRNQKIHSEQVAAAYARIGCVRTTDVMNTGYVETEVVILAGNRNSLDHSSPTCSLFSEVQLNHLQPYKWYYTASWRLFGKLLERICMT